MINYDTIISNFDDKVTLYNWLRKVEEALKNASATNFVVNKKGNATLSFSITFADGTTLESGDIVLQQGESVDDARIASGILQLHLTNGTWLTAGNIKPVSNFSIDANQHLIVNYQDGTSQDLGAIFNGNVNISGTLNATKVTGDEIIETMTGYSATVAQSDEDKTIEHIYASVVKNGNKITFVWAGNVTLLNQVGVYPINFVVPGDIWGKLYPSRILGFDCLDRKSLVVTPVESGNMVNVNYMFYKQSGAQVSLYLYGTNTMTLNTKYYIRYEATFLLSDNLLGA